jgi:hypothetical protein
LGICAALSSPLDLRQGGFLRSCETELVSEGNPLIALLAFALGYFYPGTGWNWLGWIGVVPILTAVAGWCPVYSMLGISTCPRQA